MLDPASPPPPRAFKVLRHNFRYQNRELEHNWEAGSQFILPRAPHQPFLLTILLLLWQLHWGSLHPWAQHYCLCIVYIYVIYKDTIHIYLYICDNERVPCFIQDPECPVPKRPTLFSLFFPKSTNINPAILAPVFTMSCIFVVLKSEGDNYWCVLSIKLWHSKQKCNQDVGFAPSWLFFFLNVSCYLYLSVF